MMSSLQESMLLWLPASFFECEEEFSHHVNLVSTANGAVLNFCDRELSWSDLLDTINYYGADVDDYRRVLDANLRARGF